MTPTFCTALLERLPVGVLLSDDDTGTVTWVNIAARELLSAGVDELVGVSVESLLGAPRKGAAGPDTDRHHVHAPTGERRWLQCQRTAVAAPEGGALTLRTITDITEFESRAKGRSAVMVGLDVSQLDGESGVLNRRALLTELGAEVSRSRRYGNPLSAILVRFSDCGGLREGTVETAENRRRVAETINEQLRWVDTVGVLEPGEFVIVLPETAIEASLQVQAKIRGALAGLCETAPSIGSVVACGAWSKGDIPARLIERLKAEADHLVTTATSASVA